jgi:hypothetical protein
MFGADEGVNAVESSMDGIFSNIISLKLFVGIREYMGDVFFVLKDAWPKAIIQGEHGELFIST